MKYQIYASVLLEVDLLDSTPVKDVAKITGNKILIQLDGNRGMKVQDIGHVLIIKRGK